MDKRESTRYSLISAGKEIFNPDSAYYRSMNELNNKLAYFDDASNQWKGTAVDKVKNKVSSGLEGLKKRTKKSTNLLNTSLTPEELKSDVPDFVKNIIDANNALSQSGFGPISTNSSPFFAGRWLDTQTGSVRVLPNATSKYLNPLSK